MDQINRETGEVTEAPSHRWSDPANEVFGALAKAQAGIKNALKDATNPHFRSKYADLASIKEACWEALTAAGIAVVQMPVNSGPNVGIVTLLAHGSGQWIESTIFVQPTKFDAQGVGSVITYLRRYALAAMAGVAPDEDDGEAAVGRPQAAQSNGTARSTPRRQEAAPAPSAAAAEARQQVRELMDAIDATEDPELLMRFAEWPQLAGVEKALTEAAIPDGDRRETMSMLAGRARKRREQLPGNLEAFNG